MRRQTSVYRAGSISARPSSKKLRKQKKQLEKELKNKINLFSSSNNDTIDQDTSDEQSLSPKLDTVANKSGSVNNKEDELFVDDEELEEERPDDNIDINNKGNYGVFGEYDLNQDAKQKEIFKSQEEYEVSNHKGEVENDKQSAYTQKAALEDDNHIMVTQEEIGEREISLNDCELVKQDTALPDNTECDIIEVVEELNNIEAESPIDGIEQKVEEFPLNSINTKELETKEESEKPKHIFTIKPSFLEQSDEEKGEEEEDDYEMIDVDHEICDEDTGNQITEGLSKQPTVLLDHDRYVLKKIKGSSSSQYNSNVVYSKLDSKSDICVNVLDNGNICFYNISDKHRLFLEKNLLTMLNISIDDLSFLQLFFHPNAKSLASLKNVDEISTNPGIIILNSKNGTIWCFENLKSSVQMEQFVKYQNDSMIHKGLDVNDSDFVYLGKISCLLLKNYKRELILFNLLSAKVSKLKYSSEPCSNSLFGRFFRGINTTRSDVLDFEIENSCTEQTISVLFDSDFAFYNIKKQQTNNGYDYDFEFITPNKLLEIPFFITQSVLGEVGAVIVLKFKKIYEDRNGKFYSFLLSTGFDNLILLTVKISQNFDIINYYNVNYFEREAIDNTELIQLQTTFIEGEEYYTAFVIFKENINLVDVPIFESKNSSNIVFRDIISFQKGSKIENTAVYEIEDKIKTCCISFQTTNSSYRSFYQLHLKDISNKDMHKLDSIDNFLCFHIKNYLMTDSLDTGLSNIIQGSWINRDFGLISRAFRSTLKEVYSNVFLSTIEKESMCENLLLSIHENLAYWNNSSKVEELTEVISCVLNDLSMLKCFNSIKLFDQSTKEFIDFSSNDPINIFMTMDTILVNTLDKINTQLYEANTLHRTDISSYVSRAIEFIEVSFNKPIIENIEHQLKNKLFGDIISSDNLSDIMASENLFSKISDFILLVGQLENINSNVGEGLFMLLMIFYYQNSLAQSKLFAENHIHWIESILKISTAEPVSTNGSSIFERIVDRLEHYNDFIGVFKVLDYLLSENLINYEPYFKLFFQNVANRQHLVNNFVDFYMNQSYHNKMQSFFDIILNLNDNELTNEIYQVLLQNTNADNYSEILWPFETLINQNYESAFNILFNKATKEEKAEKDEASDQSRGNVSARRLKMFELSIARLCSGLAQGKVEKTKKDHLNNLFNKKLNENK